MVKPNKIGKVHRMPPQGWKPLKFDPHEPRNHIFIKGPKPGICMICLRPQSEHL